MGCSPPESSIAYTILYYYNMYYYFVVFVDKEEKGRKNGEEGNFPSPLLLFLSKDDRLKIVFES